MTDVLPSGDPILETAGGAGKAVEPGCKVKSEREVGRLIKKGGLPRGWKVPTKTNVPKAYKVYDSKSCHASPCC